MKRLLLDTHIWLWSLAEPERLSDRVADELNDANNELWLSPISVWELGILRQKKRIASDEDLEHLISQALVSGPLREAPVTFEVAREVARTRLPHSDPADYFLVATAKVFDLMLVTADMQLQDLHGVTVLSNL